MISRCRRVDDALEESISFMKFFFVYMVRVKNENNKLHIQSGRTFYGTNLFLIKLDFYICCGFMLR